MLTLYKIIFLILKPFPRLTVWFAGYLFATPRRIPRPPHEEALLPQATRMVFECGLVAYKFGSGAPTLLVHGWEGRGTQLGHFAEPLVQKGYAVYAVDWPGHGESPGKQTTPTHYATFIKSVALELGPLKAVIAHSFGCGSTILATCDGMKVERLVLIAGPDRYQDVVNSYCNRVGMNEKTRKLFFERVTQKVGMTPESLEVSRLAQKIKIPVMIVHDHDDKAVPFAAGERIHKALLRSEFLATNGLGHRRILRDLHVIQKVSEFIVASS